jgi:predicted acetyltransferase
VDIRQLRPDDDLEIEVDLSRRAFGPVSEAERPDRLADASAAAEGGRYFAAFDGPQPVGVAMFLDMRQWWHGRALPMAGVGGVKVAPEQRGRGTGRALMTELLRVIADRGFPLSVLYPATAPLYRSLGWELAGGLYRGVIGARSIASLLPPDGPAQRLPGLRRAEPGDADEVIAVLGAVHESARHCGPATYDAATIRRWWLSDENRFCYLAADGFLAYGWHEGHGEISVRMAVAGSPETTRALWSIVGSHAPTAKLVRAVVSPDDPVAWLTREPDLGLERRWQWMLRVVDAPAAIAGRGFPAAATLAVGLQIDDAQMPSNAGQWTLEVGGGEGALTRSRPSASAARRSLPVRLGTRGFAALYGGVPMDTLRRAGLVAGGEPSADEALDAAFAGKAFLLDSF